ncbi:hypothetical protein [Stappia sp.]
MQPLTTAAQENPSAELPQQQVKPGLLQRYFDEPQPPACANA